jgi:hypothetical protein
LELIQKERVNPSKIDRLMFENHIELKILKQKWREVKLADEEKRFFLRFCGSLKLMCTKLIAYNEIKIEIGSYKNNNYLDSRKDSISDKETKALR